ncbi:phosphomannomutase/phosphoglucomutase [Thiopseudomonas alkaliphila]|uniref:phosphomannomutase/phosphoglucomutase n=1 Tax=Thiopseudomonas alkaliphila TaxID=1697053 RepID=UPI0025765138|nr:phosphomannomutase/phosphoglucomutase [Thiopseudomonas alkaliphila]MDM1708333.1 phosphomannomutase/phosphoglucomutase [Thiopseudomonas alkaliphila]
MQHSPLTPGTAGLPDALPAAKHKSLLSSALIILVSLLLAAAALFFGAHQQQQQQLAQGIQTLGQSQAQALKQALTYLQQETQAAANTPELMSALASADALSIQEAEIALLNRAGLVDAHLSPLKKAVQEPHRAAPIRFAALDLIHRTEQGFNTQVEALQVENRWFLYSAQLLPNKVGTLLLVYDLEHLLALIPRLDAAQGQVVIQQQFGSEPSLELFRYGQAAPTAASQTFASAGHWQVQFSAGQALLQDHYPLTMLLLAAALMLAGAFTALLVSRRQLLAHAPRLPHQASSSIPVTPVSAPAPTVATATPSTAAFALQPTSVTEPSSPTHAEDSLEFDFISAPDEAFDLLSTTPPLSTPDAATAQHIAAEIFRAYDIRGIIDQTITTDTAYWIGRAVGAESRAQGENTVIIARDGRLSGPALSTALCQGLTEAGCDVIDLGMVPTPVLYFATHTLNSRSGVMITGSHNPPDYNGFKIVIAGETLSGERITALHTRIQNNDLTSGNGSVSDYSIEDQYVDYITQDIVLSRPMNVVIDCGNGVAGVIAQRLFEAIGCTVHALYCEVDGTFPNHHPDPSKAENLVDLIAVVKAKQADLGIAFDGDGDRLGVVTNQGQMIFSDHLMMLLAKDVVSRNPGADVIFDVKCTRRLAAVISNYGGRPIMWKTGHSLIKSKMKETGALLAGEMSGHIFFKERWFGFDDGLYSGARLLEILSLEDADSASVFAAFPLNLATPEINLEVTEATKFGIIERLQQLSNWGDGSITAIDGVRVDYATGWGLIRASNTTPVLVLRFEGESEQELQRIQAIFRQQLLSVAPDLSLPF